MSDSDTESETDNIDMHVDVNIIANGHGSIYPPAVVSASEFAAGSALREGDGSEDIAEGAEAAVKTLWGVDLGEVDKDTSTHGTIRHASRAICALLTDLCASQSSHSEADVKRTIIAFSQLINPAFISLLFTYRRLFHRIAAKSVLPGTVAPTIICWVDVILSKMGAAVGVVGAGLRGTEGAGVEGMEKDGAECGSLKWRMEDDGLRGASQLPANSSTLPSVLSSERTSPAAKRLVIRLLFAQIVLYPQLTNSHSPDLWKTVSIEPATLTVILTDHINQTIVTRFENSSIMDIDPMQFRMQERISFAMVVALFCAADQASKTSPPPFRPHTLSSLLRFIQIIMHPGLTASSLPLTIPVEDPDAAQMMLVQWGETVSWCWRMWEDPRGAGTETVAYLTTTWFFHVGLDTAGDEDEMEVWRMRFGSHLKRDPGPAASIFLRLLSQYVAILTSSPHPKAIPQPSLAVLTRVLWAITQLSDPTRVDCAGTRASVHVCKHLLLLFPMAFLVEGGLRVVEFVIEALTLMDCEMLEGLVKDVDELGSRFSSSMEDVFTAVKQMLQKNDTAHDELILSRQLLNFLTIMWNTGAKGLHQQLITAFLSSVMSKVSQSEIHSAPWYILRDGLFTALTASRKLKPGFTLADISIAYNEDAIWQLSMDAGCMDLFNAGAFASYIISSFKLSDVLRCIDAWDYLRDVLLLTISQHFLGDDEPLALVVCPSICRALSWLLKYSDTAAVHFVAASPWSLSLRSALHDILHQNPEKSTEYSTLLNRRLGAVGKVLLQQIANKVDSTKHALPGAPKLDNHLMFCRLNRVSRVLYVPRDVKVPPGEAPSGSGEDAGH